LNSGTVLDVEELLLDVLLLEFETLVLGALLETVVLEVLDEVEAVPDPKAA
jgi:hypothetical protein